MQPGIFRVCQKCGAWFSLQVLATRPSETQTKLDTYQCSVCKRQVDFAQDHPPGAV